MPRFLIACALFLFMATGAEADFRCERFGECASVRHAQTAQTRDAVILPHPAGCPRTRFCGCGVSVKVFGKPKRDLYLASNWFRFPRARPAPGRVAVRRGHVFLIEQVYGDGTVLAYDPNSGGRKTRLHRRSLAGFRVVDPGMMASR